MPISSRISAISLSDLERKTIPLYGFGLSIGRGFEFETRLSKSSLVMKEERDFNCWARLNEVGVPKRPVVGQLRFDQFAMVEKVLELGAFRC